MAVYFSDDLVGQGRRRGGGENILFAAVFGNVQLPHDLHSPFERETSLNDLSEPHFSHVLRGGHSDLKDILDVLGVLHTRQLWYPRRFHLVCV